MIEIEIYCDDPSHEGRRWIVAVLARGDDGFWYGGHHHGQALQFLDVDDRMTGRHPDPVPDDDSPVGERLRARYRLRCRCEVSSGRRCGRSVVLREENATPIFDMLAANNIRKVSLQGLTATI